MVKKMPDSAERDDLIRKLYADGLSPSEIARRLGLTRQRLHQLLERLRVRKRKRLTPAEREKKILAMIREGKTGVEISHALGVGRDVIYKDIGRLRPRMSKATLARYQENRYASLHAKAGKPAPFYQDAIAKRRAKILPLIEKGWTLGRIADRLGCTGQTISNDLKAIGISKKLAEKIHANRVAEGNRTRAKNKR